MNTSNESGRRPRCSFEQFCLWVVWGLAALLTLDLFVGSVLYIPAGPVKLLCAVPAAALLCAGLSRWLRGEARGSWRLRMLCLSVCCFVALVGLAWSAQCDFYPDQDMGGVWSTANELFESHNDTWQKKTYFVLYPFQMVQVLFFEGLFRLLGTSDYRIMGPVSSLCLALCVWCGYLFCQWVFKKRLVTGVFLVLAGLFLPAVLLCPLFYGDIPSLACMCGACLLAVRFALTGRWRCWLGIVPLLVLGTMARNTTTLAIIACLLVLGCGCIRRRPDWQRLLAVLVLLGGTLLVCLNTVPIINRYMEFRTGDSLGTGMPPISWVVMGMQEGEAGPGGFNGWSNANFYAADRDTQRAQAMAQQQLAAQAADFAAHPGKMLDFYHRKLMWQWGSPMFGSLNPHYYGIFAEDGSIEGTALAKAVYEGALGRGMEHFMGGYVLLVYGAALAGCWQQLRLRGQRLYSALPVVLFLGGLLFFQLWEAQPRYVFPFFLMLLPTAAAGLAGLWQGLAARWGRGAHGAHPPAQAATK